MQLQDLWSSPPARHAVMVKPGSRDGRKYNDVAEPVTPERLQDHLRGAVCLSAPFVGLDGLSQAGGLDIDHGGRAAVLRALQLASAAGFVVYGEIYPASDGHDGGYLRTTPFDESVAPSRIYQAFEGIRAQLAEEFNIPQESIEIFPSGQKAYRLPFARHTRSGSWGELVLSNGQTFDRNSHEERQAARRAVQALQDNSTILLPAVQAVPIGETSGGNYAGASLIRQWNEGHDLLALLQRDGAKVAGRKGEEVYLHCACGGHGRGKENKALRVVPSRNPLHGRSVLYGYSTGCPYYTEVGKPLDALAVYCLQHNLTRPRDVLDLPAPAALPVTRKEEAAAAVTLARARVDEPGLSERARRVLAALLDVMGDSRTWCRPSNAQLVKRTGYTCKRTIQRGMHELETAGIIKTVLPDGETWNKGTYVRQLVFSSSIDSPVQPGASMTASTGAESQPVTQVKYTNQEHVRGGNLNRPELKIVTPVQLKPSIDLAVSPAIPVSVAESAVDAPALTATPPYMPSVGSYAASRQQLDRDGDPFKRERALEHAQAGRWCAAQDAAAAIVDDTLRAAVLLEVRAEQELTLARVALASGDLDAVYLALMGTSGFQRSTWPAWQSLMTIVRASQPVQTRMVTNGPA